MSRRYSPAELDEVEAFRREALASDVRADVQDRLRRALSGFIGQAITPEYLRRIERAGCVVLEQYLHEKGSSKLLQIGLKVTVENGEVMFDIELPKELIQWASKRGQ